MTLRVQRAGSQVHLAFFPFGTLSHALTNDDALAWLRDTAACLVPGGLVVFELEHPGSIFNGVLTEVRPVQDNSSSSRCNLNAPAWQSCCARC